MLRGHIVIQIRQSGPGRTLKAVLTSELVGTSGAGRQAAGTTQAWRVHPTMLASETASPSCLRDCRPKVDRAEQRCDKAHLTNAGPTARGVVAEVRNISNACSHGFYRSHVLGGHWITIGAGPDGSR